VTTEIATGFRAKYEAAVARNNSLLCVGLDPDPAQLPAGVGILDFLRGIIDATADLVCCYKPNAAFFEVNGAEGWKTLRAVIAAVPDDIPVLLDAKRGDVGHTAEFYARAIFETLGADAVTANPYLGSDALEPFLAYEDRHTFVLCRTSNPGAGELQDLRLVSPSPLREVPASPSPLRGDGGGGGDPDPLYERVAHLASTEWNTRGNVGLVVGATYPAEAARIRELAPDLLFLLPGIGAQQGDVEAAVRASLDPRGGGILVNASRGVLYANNPREAAAHLRNAINAARSA
jgi:orotidine 5'-phosphate decarboxylase subfamily 2